MDEARVRLARAAGRPIFGLRFYAVAKDGRHGAASMRGGSKERPARYAVAGEKGARLEACLAMFEGCRGAGTLVRRQEFVIEAHVEDRHERCTIVYSCKKNEYPLS